MAEVDARPEAIDARFRPGSVVTLNLNGPAGWLSGRTFTATLNGTSLGVSEDGDTLVVTASAVVTGPLDVEGGCYPLVIHQTGGNDAIIGNWWASERAASSTKVSATVLVDSIEVAVTVLAAGGTVDALVPGHGVDVDVADPTNPVVAVDETELNIALLGGTMLDGQVPSTIARDEEVTAAVLVETTARIADVDAEEAARVAADASLAGAVTAEASTRAAADALAVHLAGSETVTGTKKFNIRPVTSDLPAFSAIPTNGAAGAQAAWSTLDGTGTDLNILNVRNGDNILIDNNLTLTVIPPRVARGGLITVAANKTLTIPAGFECGPWQCFDTTASGSKVVFQGVPVVRPEWWGVKSGLDGGGSASQSAAFERCRASLVLSNNPGDGGGPRGGVIEFRVGHVYRFDSKLATTLDPNLEVWRSTCASGALLDFTHVPDADGLVATIAKASGTSTPRIVFEGLQLFGPTSRKTLVDGFMFGDGSLQANHVKVMGCLFNGFRDQWLWNSNAFLNDFDHCGFRNPARRHLYVMPGAVATGENEKFYDCVFQGGEIVLDVDESVNSGTVFSFSQCSADYLDRTFYPGKGMVKWESGHLESSPAGVTPPYVKFTDGVITGGNNLQSTLYTFVSGLDVGKRADDGLVKIPAGTTIIAVVDDHNATLSQPCTNGTGLSVAVCSDHSMLLKGNLGPVVQIDKTMILPYFTANQRPRYIKITDAGTNSPGYNAFVGIHQCRLGAGAMLGAFIEDNTVYAASGLASIQGTRVSWKGNHYTAQGYSYGVEYPWRFITRDGVTMLLEGDIEYTASPSRLITGRGDFEIRGQFSSMSRREAKDRRQLVNQRLYLVRISVPEGGLRGGSAGTYTWLHEQAAAAAGITDSRIVLYDGGVPTDATNLNRSLLSTGPLATNLANDVNPNSRTTGTQIGFSPFREFYLGIWFNATTPPEVYGIASTSPKKGWSLAPSNGPPLAGMIDIGTGPPPATIARASILPSDFLPWLVMEVTT